MIGQTEILIIGGVIILLFGATALPRLARSIGKAKREFQKGMEADAVADVDADADEESAANSDTETEAEESAEKGSDTDNE